MKRASALFLASAMMFSLWGCNAKDTSIREEEITINLSENVKAKEVSASLSEAGINAASDFGLQLFKENLKEEKYENILISPLSVLSALTMTMNGAEGETLEEMEAMFTLKRDDLNSFMKAYNETLSDGEEYKLKSAFSIWFNEKGFTVNPEFLEKNASYYNSDIFKASFNSGTKDEINCWVNEKTDGMIPSIIDELDKDVMMVILNALSFEGNWLKTYAEDSVIDYKFTKSDNKEINASYLTGKENKYIEVSLAKGFVKPYKGGKYSFAALLPNEGTSLYELAESLDGKKLTSLLKNPSTENVSIMLPKFDVSFSQNLNDTVKRMGVKLLFDERKADLSSLGSCDTNLYVSDILHKTHLSLGEKGTKAGAATAVMIEKALSYMPEKQKTVELTRPFIYMLFDNETGIPFFIGAMEEPKI